MDYDRLAAAYARNRGIHPGVLAGLLDIVPLDRASRVLEVGCGTGAYISTIRREIGCACFGCDPSREMLAIAAESASGVAFRPGRAEDLAFPPATFDLIFSVDVIHHVTDRPAYFLGAARILRDGGGICTVTDSEWIIRNREPQSRYFPDTVPIEIDRYPRIEDLERMMKEAAFEGVGKTMVEISQELTDIRPFREKAFSSLHLIREDSFAAGIRRMEEDLRKAPIPCIRRYMLVHGRKPVRVA